MPASSPARRYRRYRLVLIFGPLLGLTAAISGIHPDPAAAASNRLAAGGSLLSGQSIGAGSSYLTMRSDGDLVLTVAPGLVLWSSKTSGYPGASLTMRPDGALVIYDAFGTPRWSSGTAGRGPAIAVMQADGNFVLYQANRAIWSSRTYKQAFTIGRFPLYGWGAAQWPCLNRLWQRESRWNERAGNPYSGAYGIPQAYPAVKMAIDGADYLTNPRTQIHWGEDYIAGRYGTPCAAWAFERAYGWY